MQRPVAFDLVPRLIGRGGCNMKKISECTGAKVRIRGRGSRHFEVDGIEEAPTPLSVAVTTDHGDRSMFKKAMLMTLDLLRVVEDRYRLFCETQGYQHEGPCYSVGLHSPGASNIVHEVFFCANFL